MSRQAFAPYASDVCSMYRVATLGADLRQKQQELTGMHEQLETLQVLPWSCEVPADSKAPCYMRLSALGQFWLSCNKVVSKACNADLHTGTCRTTSWHETRHSMQVSHHQVNLLSA